MIYLGMSLILVLPNLFSAELLLEKLTVKIIQLQTDLHFLTSVLRRSPYLASLHIAGMRLPTGCSQSQLLSTLSGKDTLLTGDALLVAVDWDWKWKEAGCISLIRTFVMVCGALFLLKNHEDPHPAGRIVNMHTMIRINMIQIKCNIRLCNINIIGLII